MFSMRIGHTGGTRKDPGFANDKIMDLNDFLGPKPIVIDLQAENRWEAIDELIDQLTIYVSSVLTPLLNVYSIKIPRKP